MRDEDGAMVETQPAEAAIELIAHRVAVLDLSAHTAHDIDFVDLELDGPVPSSARRLRIARSYEEATQPALEPHGVPHGADMEPRREQRVLDRVGRHVIVAQDEACGSEESLEG